MESRMLLLVKNTQGEKVGTGTKFREILEANKTEQNRPEGTAKNLMFLYLFQYRTIKS